MKRSVHAALLSWVFALAAAGTGLCGGKEGLCVAGWEAELATWIGIEDDWIRGAVVWDDGNGESIYITGEFAAIGGFAATGGQVFNHVARWDGQSWQPLVGVDGVGLGGPEADPVLRGAAFAVFDDGSGEALYVAGRMALGGGGDWIYGVARWDGAAWSQVGGTDGAGEFNGTVESLAVFDDGNGAALYAGGGFNSVGGVETGIVARWDGQSWSALPAEVGTATASGIVLTMRGGSDAQGEALYVGGQFSSAGGIAATNIVRWDGRSWNALVDQETGANGMGGFVRAIEIFDAGSGSAVYVGGSLSSPIGFPPVQWTTRVMRWDGASWSVAGGLLEGNTQGSVWSLLAHDDGSGPALFVGGRFAEAAGRVLNHVAKLVDDEWVALPGPDGVGVLANFQAQWVLARRFVVHDEGDGAKLYIVGTFDEAGGVFADNIARWDGTELSMLAPMGAGDVSGRISALLLFDDGAGPSLFAGGSLIAAGNQITRNAARWDGAAWHPLVGSNGNGLALTNGFGRADDLLRFDDGGGEALYFAGLFNRVGDVVVGNIARWDGSAWSAVGSGSSVGTDWPIRAIAGFDDGDGAAIYAVGGTTPVLDPSQPRFARWLPGSAWEALPNVQEDGLVYEAALTHDDGSGAGLFVGGSRDGQAWLGRWRDGGWETIEDLGGFFDVVGEGKPAGSIPALEVHNDGSGTALYVGGLFGAESPGIARWDGSSFTAVGGGFTDASGQPGRVRELLSFDDGSGAALIASGDFVQADGETATRIARWDGTSWQPLEGPNGEGLLVSQETRVPLAGFDDGDGVALFAGGRVIEAGGVASVGFAKWRRCADALPVCPGDLNGDGVVDADDLGVLLGAFGVSDAGDLNGDGVTNADDLGVLLGAFGSVCE